LNLRQAAQQRLNGRAERSGPFAMDDADLPKISRCALIKVRRNEFTQIRRTERMKVEFARDRKWNGRVL
jgi:hypothetical protein